MRGTCLYERSATLIRSQTSNTTSAFSIHRTSASVSLPISLTLNPVHFTAMYNPVWFFPYIHTSSGWLLPWVFLRLELCHFFGSDFTTGC